MTLPVFNRLKINDAAASGRTGSTEWAICNLQRISE